MDVASSYLLCEEDTGDVVSWTETPSSTTTSEDWVPSFPNSDQYLSELLAFETHHMPRSDYLTRLKNRSIDTASRQDAINWILKVNEFFRFRPVTTYLSVSYLDRFLSMHSLPEGTGGWPMQLLSVACVSVAAKMEETRDAPLLLDLQCIDATSRFLFEPRTVRRMELLLMSALQWRMHAVTPFDFLPFASEHALHLLPRASGLIINTLLVVDFLSFRPSTMAEAALLCVASETTDYLTGDGDYILRPIDNSITKEAVTGCCQLMQAYLVDTCPSSLPAKRSPAVPPPPPSPIGILDAAACGSCDSHKSSAPATPVTELAGAERPLKRRRLRFGEGDCTDDTGEDK